MVFTKRFIFLLGLGVVFLGVGYIIGFSLPMFILYNFICFIILLIDFFTSPKEEILEIERMGEDKLSIYENEKIQISVYNKSDSKIYIEMKDEVPNFHFDTKDRVMKGYVPPHSKETFEYEVTPTKRGVFEFGSIHVRYKTRLKLSMKQFKVIEKREYKVYPNLKKLQKYRLAVFKNKSHDIGRKALKMLNRGTAFESLREYVAGDEYRKINWSATARENKPIVNQYEPEKNQNVYILIDTGRPMSYTVRGYKKLDLAINTGLLLSDIVNQNGDLSGLMIFNQDVKGFIKPSKGMEHRHSLMEALYHIEHNNNTSNYEEALFYLKRNEKRRSLLCFFTDFDTLEEAEDMVKVLSHLARNNIVMMILIKDKKLENIVSQPVKNEEEVVRKGVALDMLSERKKIIHTLNSKGIMCIECEPEKVAIDAINQYLHIKNRMSF